MTLRTPLLVGAWLAAVAASVTPVSAQDTSASPKRPHITGLSHAAFYVSDVEKARAFYKDFLGFEEPYSLKNKDGSLHLTWIKINDRQTVEIFPEKEANTDRLYHIAVETDDAEAMRLYLQSKGVAVPAKTAVGQIGNANYFIKDPDGNIVEIVEYKPDGWTAKNKGKFMPESRVSVHMTHAGVKVGDLEASLKFYIDVLGFKETWRGSSNGKVLSWVNVKVPDGTDYVELMLYDNEKPLAMERLHTVHHICLEVPDVTKTEQLLKTRKMPAECKAPTEIKAGVNGKRQINYYDPDGTRVEVMEPKTFDGKPVPPSTVPPPHAKAATS